MFSPILLLAGCAPIANRHQREGYNGDPNGSTDGVSGMLNVSLSRINCMEAHATCMCLWLQF